jgi:chaperone required for assembly of F1-ATPase
MPSPADPLQKPRRFYKAVTVEPAAEGGFAVLLDGRAPRSPRGAPLVLPSQALASLIGEEWAAQDTLIDMAAMPATRLAHTALDVVAAHRAQSIEAVGRFAAADLLCYFADAPASLVRRQERMWTPVLDWAREGLGLRFEPTAGVVHRPQPPATLERLHALLEPLDDFTLAGVAFAAALFGSAILALALAQGRLGAEAAMTAARLDEIFQEEQWGVDAEAEARADAMAVEAVMAERWFAALRGARDALVTATREG